MSFRTLLFASIALAATACTVAGPEDGGNDFPADESSSNGNAVAVTSAGAGGATSVGATGATTATSGAGGGGTSSPPSTSGAGGGGGMSANTTTGTTTGGQAPCPADVICVDNFPFVHATTTTNAALDAFDSYSCGSQNEAGPEVVYRIDVPSAGFLTVNLPQNLMDGDADIDVHILGSLDPNDCIDRGHWKAGELLNPGTYYVVADTWTNASGVPQDGAFTIELGLITLDDLEGWGMDGGVAYDALHVYDRAWEAGHVETDVYAVVDFSLHASKRRMWVFDTFNATLKHRTFTTVGDASDPNADGFADIFSNVNGSHQSSIGLVKANEPYTGMYGKSVRLDGLEPGYNTGVRNRAIVIHPWNGSAPAYVAANPTTGAAPTWGCLGIDPAIAEQVRDDLSGGGLVLSHFPDGDWSNNSSFLP